MNVFAFVGSPRGEESTGNLFIKKVEKYVKEANKDASFNIFRADKLNIRESDGSSEEFITGKTRFDDDMQIIEEALLKSDFIIFISPVYAHNISSQTKKLIDRLSYWLHIFRLVGKKGYAISVSYNNGNEFVNSYLTEIMQFFGIYVLGNMSIETGKINDNNNILESYARVLAKKIIMSQETIDIDIPYQQEKMFEHQKKQHLESKIDSVERKFWEENEYFKYKTFEELFISRTNN